MKKLIILAACILLAVGLFFNWGTVVEVGAQIGEYFTEDPDRPPGMQGEFDEADYMRRREEFVALLRGVDPSKPYFPDARIKANALMDKQKDLLKEKASKLNVRESLLTGPTWVELGPNPIPLGQTSGVRSNVSGRVAAIEIDPSDPNKLYVGAAQGGVYRSTDGGTTWTPIFDSAQTLAIGALTLDAANNRLWVGTGEANGSADSFAGVGLYRIDDPATTATLVGPINPIRNYNDAGNVPRSAPVFQGRSISKILISPTDPNTLLVGSAGGVIGLGGNPPFGGTVPPAGVRGLYKLGGVGGAPASATATRIAVSPNAAAGGCFDNPCTGNRNVNDMVFDLSDPTGNTVIVWLNGINVANDGGIYRSTNALSGAPTFTQTFVTPSTSTSNGRGQFAIAQLGAGNPARIYAASGEPSTGGSLCNSATNFGGLRRSVDGGATWSAELPGGGGFCAGQCFYNIGFDIVAGASSATDKLFLGGNVTSGACARQQSTSLDGGATAFTSHTTVTHADTHVIKPAPSNPSIVYRGDDGGIWKSTDGGDTFAPLNNTTFRATQFQSIAMHPTDPNITIGGTQDNGTEAITGPGPTWAHSDDGDGGFALIDQSTPTTMYHTFFNQTGNQIGFQRSINGGASWPTNLRCSGTGTSQGISCTDAVNFYCPAALGPGSPNNTVYIGTDRLYRSATQGTANAIVSQAPLVAGVPISSIGISQLDDNYRLVGNNNGALWFTTTGSSTLTSLDPVGAGSVIPDFYVARLVFDPINKNTAYIALGNFSGGTAANQSHLWRITNLDTTPVITSRNGTGLNILPDVPINGFVVVDSNTLYAGTDIGVYASTDGGANWAPFSNGLPRVAVFDMAYQATHKILRIATHGRGMWEINFSKKAAVADFDGDGKTDLSVFRPSDNNWYAFKSSGTGALVQNWGVAGDVLTPGDFDGDGKTDTATFRPSTGQWLIFRSSDSTTSILSWGVGGDVPVAGDYDGDGRTDVAQFRPSDGNWYVFRSSDNGVSIINWGVSTDVPVQADYDGDGKTDVAVFRPSTGVWYAFRSTAGPMVIGWGIAGDKPVESDFDGDGKADVAIYRPSEGNWYVFRSSDNGVQIVNWGNSTDIPVPGDYDGDGKADEAVFRNGQWFVFQSTAGPMIASWGAAGDAPIPAKYIP